MQTDELEGALTGALVALGANWLENDNRHRRQVVQAKDTAHAALQLFRDLVSSGFFQRLERPIVADALGGLMLAEQKKDHPGLAPSLNQLRRIDLADGMRAHIQSLQWPLKEGEYDEQGMAKKAGDLSSFFLGLVYAESQSWILGLLQKEPPTEQQRTQIYGAAQALTRVLYKSNLTLDQFGAAWTQLFADQGAGNEGSGKTDPHAATRPGNGSPAYGPPMLSQLNLNLSVVPLGSEAVSSYQTLSQNHDRASKWRIVASGSGVSAGSVLFQVNFGSPWTRNGQTYVPVVAAQGMGICVVNVTPSGFQVVSTLPLVTGSTLDVGFATVGA